MEVDHIEQITEREVTLHEQNHCCLCGTALKFKHEADYAQQTMKEQAQCPSCQINLREKVHRLQ